MNSGKYCLCKLQILGGFVKLVYIVVRPSKVEVVKSALSAIKINGATLFDVRGFGSSKGHTSSYRGSEYVTCLLYTSPSPRDS